jgi:predicted HicB family RNase H-like nuclease
MATNRKPMTFSMEAAAPAPAAPRKGPAVNPVDRQHVGARVPRDKYRQLKARAALDGVSVQTLVEQAIDQILATTPQR